MFRWVKVPSEIAIPFLLLLAVIAFTVPVRFGGCTEDPASTDSPFIACVPF